MRSRSNIAVYIAGPYTAGTDAEVMSNVRAAISMADTLRSAGFQVYVPHLSHFWHIRLGREYEDWLDQGFFWLGKCNVVLLLPGWENSKGAKLEYERARSLSMPIYDAHEIDLLLEHGANDRLRY